MAVQFFGMSAFELIPLVTSLIAVTISTISFVHQNRSQKRTVTLHMHTIWNSEGMRRSRRNGFFGIGEAVKLGKICVKQLSSDQAYALLDIKQFFADLNHLLEVGVLDKKLAKKLFGAATKVWFEEVLLKIEHDDGDFSQQSKTFFEARVLPLRSRLST
jgi:hypothetical protein